MNSRLSFTGTTPAGILRPPAGKLTCRMGVNTQIRSNLWAINPQNRIRRSPRRNRPRPAAPCRRRSRPWPPNKSPAKRADRRPTDVSPGTKTGETDFPTESPAPPGRAEAAIRRACGRRVGLGPLGGWLVRGFCFPSRGCRNSVHVHPGGASLRSISNRRLQIAHCDTRQSLRKRRSAA